MPRPTASRPTHRRSPRCSTPSPRRPPRPSRCRAGRRPGCPLASTTRAMEERARLSECRARAIYRLSVHWAGQRRGMSDELEPTRNDDSLSMEEIEAQDAVSLPDKEVLSLLNVDANVDLGLDLAAPVDLAAAANLNVAAPIEAAASANVLSPDAQSLAVAQQTGTIDQGISGSAHATAPQDASIDQSADAGGAGTIDGAGGAADAQLASPADGVSGA